MIYVMLMDITMIVRDRYVSGIYSDHEKWSCSSKRSMKAYAKVMKAAKVHSRVEEGEERVKKRFKLEERFIKVRRV
jgi:hypothetical protein